MKSWYSKDSCWSVETIYNPRELPGVSTTGLGIGRGVTNQVMDALGFDYLDYEKFEEEGGGVKGKEL
jgi:hypothetical protein